MTNTAIASQPTKKRRIVNYAAANRPETDRLHRMILAVLAVNPNMRASEIAKAVGHSRTGIQYHLRKLAYLERIDMMLRPIKNGQLAFVCRLRFHVHADAIAA
jgi:DNA-binding Lrp family transcriptional regulator